MKVLFDLFPILLFFAVFKWGNGHPDQAQSMIADHLSGLVSGGVVTATQAPILLATAVAIVASFAQIGYLLVRRKKVDAMLWMSLVIITLFGGATIYFHNETFIKWKPTVLYWCFSAALLLGQFVFKRNLIRSMMEKQISLPDAVWDKLNLAWSAFFAATGIVNLVVAYSFSTATWVNFKVFGITGLMFAFMLVQALFLSKHLKGAE